VTIFKYLQTRGFERKVKEWLKNGAKKAGKKLFRLICVVFVSGRKNVFVSHRDFVFFRLSVSGSLGSLAGLHVIC